MGPCAAATVSAPVSEWLIHGFIQQVYTELLILGLLFFFLMNKGIDIFKKGDSLSVSDFGLQALSFVHDK